MEEGGFVSRPAGRGGGVCGGKMPKIPTPRLWQLVGHASSI